MDIKETLKVLGYIKVAYPNAYSKLGEDDLKALTALWARQFKDYDYQTVMAGVDAYISADTSGFMPQIGQIKDIIYKHSSNGQMTELEAWKLVKQALSRSGWYADEEFTKLPPTIQKLVSPQMLHEWALADTSEVDTVIASNFMRSYRARVKDDREEKLLPNDVHTALSLLAEKMKLIEK